MTIAVGDDGVCLAVTGVSCLDEIALNHEEAMSLRQRT